MTNNHEYYLSYVNSVNDIPGRYKNTFNNSKSLMDFYKDKFILIASDSGTGKTQWCFDFIKARLKWARAYERKYFELEQTCEKVVCQMGCFDNEEINGGVIAISEEDEKLFDHYEKQKFFCQKNLYVDWRSFYKDIHKWEDLEQAYFRNRIARFSGGLLFLDDLPLFDTQAQKDLFHAVINDRYRFDLPTVLVTQYEPERWFSSMFYETEWRIKEVCRKLKLKNINYRKK